MSISSAKGRIQGGEDAPMYEYGWMIQLITHNTNSDSITLCGASIINDRIVLTAVIYFSRNF